MTLYYSFIVILIVAMLLRVVFSIVRKITLRKRLIVLLLALFACSTTIGYFSAAHLSQLRAMRDWPTVTGTVIESRIVGEKAIVPYVVYSYDLNSNPHLGTSDLGTPAFGNKSKRLNEAETLIADYPVGTRVEVHYDPVDPRDSYIVSAVPWNAYAQAGIWLFLSFGSAVVLMFFGFKSKQAVR